MSRGQLWFSLEEQSFPRDFICGFMRTCGWGCRKNPISEFPINEYIGEQRVRAVVPLGSIEKYAVSAAPTKEPTNSMSAVEVAVIDK